MLPEPGITARLRAALLGEGGVLVSLFVLLVIVETAFQPYFLTGGNVVNVLRSSAFLIIAACGQMLTLLVGGIDLSIGAVIALTSVVSSSVMAGLPGYGFHDAAGISALGVVAGLGTGAVVGAINGFTVAVLRVPAFMATLGTMSIADGTGLLLTNGIPIYGMPPAFVSIAGRAIVHGLPVALYIAAVVVALLGFAIKFTRFGRYIYATGGNLQAAMVSGIPTRTMLMFSYILASMLGSVTGLLLTAEIGSGQATTGESLMLESIAAAVLAGVSLRGGIGRIELVVLAAIFLLTLTNAMDLMRVDTRLQLIILGVVLAIAVSAEALSRREALRV